MSLNSLRLITIIPLRLFLLSMLILLFIPIADAGDKHCVPNLGIDHLTSTNSECFTLTTQQYNDAFGTSCTQSCTFTNQTNSNPTEGWITERFGCANTGGTPAQCDPQVGGGSPVFITSCTNGDDYVIGSQTCQPASPTACNDPAGQLRYENIGSQAAASICVNDCIYNYNNTFGGLLITSTGGVSTTSVEYISSGQECQGNENTNTQGQNSSVTDTDANGVPEIDGQELPPTPPPSNGCTLLGNGSLYCGGGAPTPPAPDDGTPGMGATPDQTVTNTNNNTTNNYFGPGTTSGSSTGTPDGQDDGVCDPSTETCGTDEETASDGGCGQLPTCTGDPIQCVMMKMQHDTRCNLQTDIEDVTEAEVMSQIGVTETIEDWKAANDADPENNIDVDMEFFQDTPGNATCPADFSISVPFMATPVVIPNQPICDFLDFLRPAVLALSYLVSGLMLFAAFRDGI